MLCYTRFLGYTRDENHKIVVAEDEAKIVGRIYAEFISGKPIAVIRKELMDKGITAPCGGKEWHYTTIYSILHDEKYKITFNLAVGIGVTIDKTPKKNTAKNL